MGRSTLKHPSRVAVRHPGPGAPPRRPNTKHGLPGRWTALAALLAVAAIAVATFYVMPRGEDDGAVAVLRTSDFHSLALSPADPNLVFFGHHNGVMRSRDGGQTWAPLVDRPNLDAMALAVSRADPRQIYLAGHDVFMFSGDGGASWRPVAHDLPGTDLHGFAMDPNDPRRLYAFVVGHGIFASLDGGRQWEKLGDGLPGDVMVLATGGNPQALYVGSMSSGVLKSGDGGRTWAPSGGLNSRSVVALTVDAAGQTVYAGTDDGLYRSDDGGGSWRKLPYPGRNAVSLAISPGDSRLLLAIEAVREGEGLLYRSADGGATWTRRR